MCKKTQAYIFHMGSGMMLHERRLSGLCLPDGEWDDFMCKKTQAYVFHMGSGMMLHVRRLRLMSYRR
jgi:hypothetical protein